MDLIRRDHPQATAVEDLQSRLAALGIHIAESELGGSFGPSTESAVKQLQQQRGLNVDGMVGDATWRELVDSSWALGDRILRLSEPALRGDDVRDLQMRLNALGFNAGKHDGIFGPATEQALLEFQRNLAIDEDRILGHETVRALDRLRLVIKPGLGPRITEREARRSKPPGIVDKRIALDPGHGGEDPGEMAETGQSEAEIVFKMAARVAVLLDAKGAVTLLTRGPNDSPAVSDRAMVANEAEADLFVSFHMNSHRLPEACGAATYYFQHGAVASEPGEHLADLIQHSLVKAGFADCRSHGKAYPLLRETRMPAVKVEPGFISNNAELETMVNSEGLDATADAIADAIEAYFTPETT